VALASVLTVAAFPAVWLANKDGEAGTAGRPNVAAVGLPAGSGTATEQTATTLVSADPMGEVGPLYLSTTPPRPPSEPIEVAFGSDEDQLLARARAPYRAAVGRAANGDVACWYNGIPGGEYITVLNPANGRSIQCWTVLRADDPSGEVVLSPSVFGELADPTDAPVHVEIRQ
jgi:hypothetical protein